MKKELELVEEMIIISKELFEYNKDKEGADNLKEHIRLWESIKSFLIELKQIKEANPNEALENIIQAFEHTLEVSNKARLIFNEKPVSVDWNELAEIKILKQALLELKAIKEANPSEAIKCLEKLDDMFYMNGVKEIASGVYEPRELSISETKEYDTIKNYILKTQGQDEESTEYKKVSRLIKEKRVNIDLFWNDFVDNGFGYHYYLEKWYKYQSTDKQKLTEEEFETLKRWLEK